VEGFLGLKEGKAKGKGQSGTRNKGENVSGKKRVSKQASEEEG
jgi:hypothetical protein